ncbi:RNA polymerase sigma-70 factor, ECF subfamily [Palleronia marisminoris]|uniref:RNA polymerase sigma factor SigX n=1 Tax=Palleronia marisminoris TaxID=315423 RepID=A0A1Y5TS12_9RHOB|nr:sigma factor [Palleronia marisminoris]SFH46257.1 RNA polymerase sigma-70 factor, ECF subfamily [Palleronia marisminoris]SLN68286.1 RNA polymerase sigma factor SigX [Palleronia marisminoris]
MTRSRDARWADLLRRANCGDDIAYSQFLREISPVLWGVIVARHRGSRDECKDILQETLIAVHEKRHTLRTGDPVAPWLYAIARYKTVDAFRRRPRHFFISTEDKTLQIADPNVVSPEVALDVEMLLSQLDVKSAGIVRAIKLLGDSADEASARYGMTAGAVRVALHRALARLVKHVVRNSRR